MPTFIKHNLAMMISAALLIVCSVAVFAQTNSHQRMLAAQADAISALQSQISLKQTAGQQAQDEAVKAATGLDASRKQHDDDVVRALMSKATTWSSYAEYTAARDSVKRLYKFDDSSTFLTVFMPPVKTRTDASGTSFNEIDTNGYNMRFGSLSTTVVAISATTYTYFAVVSVATSSRDRSASLTSYDSMSYSVDSDGQLSAVVVTPVVGDVSHA